MNTYIRERGKYFKIMILKSEDHFGQEPDEIS